MTCPRCQALVPEASRFCPSCGGALELSDAATMLAAPSGRPLSSSGWIGSSPAIDHGRFQPGGMIDGRYRVIGLIGKGGMGEVYRADDLRLGQTVALKFLPDSLAHDPVRLAQFHNEVRTARQVTHPNVCRVHDIGDVDGRLYLSMEYVDGEDLATSLRRIGRFPEDKALEIARQIAAGLAAAHERGVLHRDLKPANIMIDGSGRARLMDFGLAAIGDVTDITAGTPAYMAPEQLLGREVTARSDIFALGLVLYELFTGRRAFQASSIADLVSAHESSDIVRPTELVKSLPASVDRVVLRCLERNPADRPASALAVSAALPGGDPLAAALAAGETPSPEMVAASGGEAATVSAAAGVALVALITAGLVLSAWLAGRYLLVSQIDLPLHPRTLEDRASELERRLGNLAVRDVESGLFMNTDIQDWLQSLPDGDRARVQASGWPSPILFWQRSSPRPLVPSDPDRLRPTRGDPPMTVTGMSIAAFTMNGRLIEYQRVPRQVEPADARSPGEPAVMDWSVLFGAAGLDPSTFQRTTSEWTPRFYADERAAWVETTPSFGTQPMRIEAASHLGELVNFQLVGPWARPAREQMAPVDSIRQLIGTAAGVVIVPAVIVAGVLVARRNFRLGRGDRRGAAVLGATTGFLALAVWLSSARHFPDVGVEQTRAGRAIAAALFTAVTSALLYLAAEPTVRRVWPQILVTWSRLRAGRMRDPMVGRDLLIGCAAGLVQTLVTFGHHALPPVLGVASFRPAPVRLETLLGANHVLAYVFTAMGFALSNAILGALGLVLLRMVARRPTPTFLLATLVFAPLAAQGQIETGLISLDLLLGVVLVGAILFVIYRFGLVAGALGFFVHFVTKDLPLTLDGGKLYFASSLMAMALVVGLAVIGFVWARANEPMFGRLAED